MSPKRLRVAQACDVPFATMEPREGGRHCSRCDRVVADLSAMTRREAVALYRARGGDLCGYLAHDGAGEPLHVPERTSSRVASTALAVLLAACDATEPSEPRPAVTTPTAASGALSPRPMMLPIDSQTPAPVTASLEPPSDGPARLAGADEPAIAPTGGLEPIAPSAEDRALERRKRAARRPRRPPPHSAFAGMMLLDD